MTSSGPWSRGIRTTYDDDVQDYNASYRERYATCSPTTRRRLITKVERRLAELRNNSESMAEKLERAEKDLHELKLEEDGDRRLSAHRALDDVSDDSLLSDDTRVRRHRRDDREALRHEISRLREDLKVLRRQTSPARDYVADDAYARRRHVTNDYSYGYDTSGDYGSYGGRHYDDYNYQYNNNTTVNDDLRQMRRSKTSFDDLDYNYRYVSRPTSYCDGTGLRSSFSRPLPTQHNRATLMTSSSYNNYRWMDVFDTTGMRNYKPYGPADVSIGDIVKFRRSGGKMERGRIMYVGHLPGKSEAILGVELETSTGNHDGLHNGFRYFQCKPNRGLFVPFDHVVLAWSRT